MKWAAETWSSPLQRGVQETSPIPVNPASVWTFTSRNGETTCEPPRPLRIASSGLIGTRMEMVSMWVILIDRFSKRVSQPRTRVLGWMRRALSHGLASVAAKDVYQTDVADAGCWNLHQRKNP